MNVRSFLDTNVLVYTDDDRAPEKRDAALELLGRAYRSRKGVISTQVLCEYFVTATKKLGVSPAVARDQASHFSQLHVVTLRANHILDAIDMHRLHQFSLWDCLILRAARESGCQRLYSEDLQPGRTIDGVEVVNPFAGL